MFLPQFSLHDCTIKFAPVRLRRRVCCVWMQYRQTITCQFLGAYACIHVFLWRYMYAFSVTLVCMIVFLRVYCSLSPRPCPSPQGLPSGPRSSTIHCVCHQATTRTTGMFSSPPAPRSKEPDNRHGGCT